MGSRTRLAGTLASAALTVAVAGCGGGGSGGDVAKIKQTVQRAFAALADGNGAAFCALATPSGQAELAKAIPGASCAKVVRTVNRQLTAQVKLGLHHAQIARVTIKGSRATVSDADITASQGTLNGFLQAKGPPTVLTKQSDGSWKISG